MASDSVSNRSCIVEVGEDEYPCPSHNFPSIKIDVGEDEYPYPSHNFAINIVTVKLSGRDVYNVWKKQMLCLFTSHNMLGFIDGQFLRPFDGNGKAKDEVMKAWIRSDSLASGWILGSLSEKVAIKVVNRLTSKHKNADFSAKDAWDEVKSIYGPSVPQQTEGLNPSCEIDVGEDEYPYGPSNNFPYPSHNFANINIVTVKLSGRDVYNVWKTQTLCLLTSHNMLGFIDGSFLRPSDGNSKAKEEDMKAWIRSDSLVKGWILGSLSEKTAIRVVHHLTSKHEKGEFSAKDAWDELNSIFGPREVSTPVDAISDDTDDEEEIIEISEACESLYQLILLGKSEKAYDKLRELKLTPTDIITSDGNTSLHVAVSTKNKELLEELLNMIQEENSELLNKQNLEGSTLLHVAAIVGNTEAVDVLVKRNPRLLFAMDENGLTPLAISLYNLHTKTSLRLLEYIENDKENHSMFSGKTGDELLIVTISYKKFSLALKLVRRYGIIDSEAVLMAIARNLPCEHSFWEWIDQDIDYHAWEAKHRRLIRSRGPSVPVIRKFLIFGISKFHMVFTTVIKNIVPPLIKERLQTRKDAIDLLWAVFLNIETSHVSIPLSPYQFTNLVFEAIRLNAFEIAIAAAIQFPDQISSVNEDGLNFIQYAVINRSERTYSLLYSLMHKDQDYYKRIKDPYGNNLLHLAGRLAPANKLNLISGAALQVQHELKWFKEVEEFVGPITRIQKNYDDETPEMVFTREHMDLVSEGEKWMKTTAESYTITATLIITIVFAAAITVPGGNNQDTGIPVHNHNIAFNIFAVSDALSLFAAVTSLLMFLSILTTRFSEKDFLYKLPKKLIIGLAALFISTSAMIIAFGATLFLVFGHDNSWILIPIGVLTCLLPTNHFFYDLAVSHYRGLNGCHLWS